LRPGGARPATLHDERAKLKQGLAPLRDALAARRSRITCAAARPAFGPDTALGLFAKA